MLEVRWVLFVTAPASWIRDSEANSIKLTLTLSLQTKVITASVAWANVQTVPASSRSNSASSCLRNFTSQEVQTVQYERGFGGRPATTLKVTSGPGSLQRPVPPAKPQGFRKPQGFWASHSAPRSGAPGLFGTSRPLGRSSPRASVSVGQVTCIRRRRRSATPLPFKPQGFSVSGPVSFCYR